MRDTIDQLRKRQSGQTLIIAMIVLGVLLLLGFVFIGFIRQNILGAARGAARSAANDLAEAGVRYAHAQLLRSELGADWRGTPNELAPPGQDVTLDPDVYYLRPASGRPFRPGSPQLDLGGPDGLGPFVRVNYANGRALVRVRYGPSDANILSASPTGALRNPAAVRNYLIVESIGREGRVTTTDPTTLAQTGAVQFRNFADSAALQAGVQAMRRYDAQFANSRRLIAFASIPIIDTARYITNKDNVSRAADIGIPRELGARYADGTNSVAVGDSLPLQLGTEGDVANPSTRVPRGFGSLYSNADLQVHGTVRTSLNAYLGDQFTVAGAISGAPGAQLLINRTGYNPATGIWTSTGDVPLPTLNSRDPNFSTGGGLVRDGVSRPDPAGFPRGAGRKEPPSLDLGDSDSGESRYVLMTRESGVLVGSGNSGRFGFGSGVYVDNSADRQEPEGEAGRAAAGGQRSLVYDWLNPNNEGSTAWRGGFYTPPGAYVRLLSDGFTIQRDAASPKVEQRTWKTPSGSDSGRSLLRFRLGPGADGRVRIVNSLTPDAGSPTGTVDIDAANPNFNAGPVFNGVLYFAGNVRVRGTIPTDVPMTVVSNGTIYIEGNILKGVVGNNVTAPSGVGPGQRLTRPSRSMLMLAARDYVAVNTTQFVGPQSGQPLSSVNDVPNGAGYAAVRMDVSGSSPGQPSRLGLQAELPLDPNSAPNPSDPSQWRPYATEYYSFGSSPSTGRMPTLLLLTHTMEDGAAPATFVSLDVNRGAGGDPAYYFPTLTNTAAVYAGLGGNVATYPIYGLGGESWQRYNKFETRGFTLIDPANASVSGETIASSGPTGAYRLLLDGGNDLTLYPNLVGGAAANDYLLARAALTPSDVRIEASIFAENGSFFVIPGPWFNPNPNDRRDAYEQKVASYRAQGMADDQARAQANQDRREDFGTYPETPFFGEPLDVRVVVVGAVSENMPPPISQQAEWLRKWGWIPRAMGALRSGSNPLAIPAQHVPTGFDAANGLFVPNLIVQYDPTLATARIGGFQFTNDPSTLVRADDYGRALPPLPRLPVSPTLAYFGEVQ